MSATENPAKEIEDGQRRHMSREEIIKQLPDDLHKLGAVKGMMGPPSLEDYQPIAFTDNRATFFETLVKQCKANPFVPLGMTATVFFLSNGLRQMVKRNSLKSQQMMRGRVLAQGFTIVALVGGLAWEVLKYGKNDDNKEK